VLRNAWRFTATMSLIAICVALFTQIDRVILSRIVSLDDFGHYTLAWVVASGLAVVILPALNTLFPRFSALVALGDASAIRSGFHEGAQVLSVLLLPLTSVVLFYAFPILDAWTGNPAIARSAAPLALVLTAGMAMNGLMYPVYALQLASGATRLALALTVGALIVMVPLVTILAFRNGVTGAAFAWPMLNLLYFIVGSIATFRRLLPGAGREWILHDIGVPLLAAAGTTLIAQALLPLPPSRPGTIAVLGGVVVCSTLAAALATRSTRAAILKLASR
jgi:O-antigen/teichoic acid export membrane protein